MLAGASLDIGYYEINADIYLLKLIYRH